MNPDLNLLHPYPFEKLAKLHAGITPPAELKPIALSIGEPKHPAPKFVADTIQSAIKNLSVYPSTKGVDALRESIACWLERRFSLSENAVNAGSQVLPVNGTREALFSFAQVVVNRANKPLVLMPNPFYQIYEGAAFLAGAEPYFLACTEENNFIPDYDAVPAEIWRRCELLFLCSPGNPTGAVTPVETLQKLIRLADEYDFVIASDECYSELYFDKVKPPVGLLQACNAMGRTDFARCVVFHSLSKRSNLPGMRSGFVAGDAAILKPYLLYRTYHGSAMPIQHQLASVAAWNDEEHVRANRNAYREKFSTVLGILKPALDVDWPDASFYLWPRTPISEEVFAKELFAQKNVVVLPGSYLSRETNGVNPGLNRVRMALVAPLADCVEAAQRIRDFVLSIK